MKILLLLSLLSCPMLIGCGKKTESDGKSATGNDGEAVESTNGVSAETSASPENKLIGYWASDFKKTLENLKVLEVNSSDDLMKKEYGALIKSVEEGIPRDSWPGALKKKFIIQIEKDGKIKVFVEGSEVGVGTYSIIDVKDTSSSWRVDAGLIGSSEGFSITLDGDTLQMSPPGGVTATGIPMLFSRTDKFVPKIRPKLEGVNEDELEHRDGLVYTEGSNTPYTGKVYELHSNGQKEKEGNFKDGKMDGLWVGWHKNGQKAGEGNFKDGKLVEGSEKRWNSKGEPIKLESVNEDELERREGIMYLKSSDTPYTGSRIRYENGKKWSEANYKDGKRDGLLVFWHENGQKMREINYKDGKKISEKWWNSKGEPVDSRKEAK